MRRLKVFGLLLVSLFVVGVMTAAAASAESTPLPDIHVALAGEAYPLDLAGEVKSAGIKLENEISKLPATLVSILLLVSELTSLGLALIDFTGVEEPVNKETCKTTGDGAGVVLIPNAEWHMVYTSLSPTHTLETAGLILFSKFIITCGALETTTTGPSMARLSEVPGNSTNGGDSTAIETASHCVAGKQGLAEVLSYFTDQLVELTNVLLKASISGGASTRACEEIPGTLLLVVASNSTGKMFSVLL
jgi:hypothetical protein